MSSIGDTKQELRNALGYFWNKLFKDEPYVDAQTTSVAIRAQTTRQLENSLSKYLSRYTIPVYKIHDTRLFVFSTRDMDKVRYRYGEGEVYTNSSPITYDAVDDNPLSPRFPIGDFVPPYLSTSILGPEYVLSLGTDYDIVDGYIIFRESPLEDANIEKTLNTDVAGSYNTFQLWAFKSTEDLQDLCNFFGSVCGVCGYSSEDLKEAINIAWDLRVNGASESLVNRMLSLIADVDYVDEGGVVRAIYTEGDRRCVRTSTRVYTAPKSAIETVSLGQRIAKNDTLFDSFEIHRGSEVLSEEFLPGLTLGEGYIELPFGGGAYFKNSFVEITRYKPEGWYEVLYDGSAHVVRNRDGNIINVVSPEEATELLSTLPREYYSFEIGCTEENRTELLYKLNNVDADGKSFFDRLADKYGRVPTQIRPFEEVRDFYLKGNSVFVKIKSNLFTPAVTGQLLNILRNTIPAGSSLFLFTELSGIEEVFSSTSTEDVEVFYINDIVETDNKIRTELVSPVGHC